MMHVTVIVLSVVVVIAPVLLAVAVIVALLSGNKDHWPPRCDGYAADLITTLVASTFVDGRSEAERNTDQGAKERQASPR
jgi:hypothetical protein